MKDAKILIVDDKKVNRRVLAAHLQRGGFKNIVFAENGLEAIEITAKKNPDIILLDIMMPVLDGYGVLEELKKGDQTQMIPIIMVTAIDDRDAKIKALEMGADDFVNKPVESMELIARVKSLLRIKRYFTQLQKSNAALLSNIKTAERIHKILFPRSFPSIDGVFFHARYQPAEFLGGDSYNVFMLDGENVCLYVADLTGHDLDAAMLSVFIKEAVAGYTREAAYKGMPLSPRQCLLALDELYKQEKFPADMFVTIFIAVFNLVDKKLTYSAAGIVEAPVLYGRERICQLHCPGSLIMSIGQESHFEEKSIILKEEEGILFFTDGLVEQKSPVEKKQYGSENLIRFLTEYLEYNQSYTNIIPQLFKELSLYTGEEIFSDDIALLQMHIRT